MDDKMLEEVLEEMLGDTEKETDKNLFPAKPEGSGSTVTITIEHGKPAEVKKDEEPEDGGYADLMKGLS